MNTYLTEMQNTYLSSGTYTDAFSNVQALLEWIQEAIPGAKDEMSFTPHETRTYDTETRIKTATETTAIATEATTAAMEAYAGAGGTFDVQAGKTHTYMANIELSNEAMKELAEERNETLDKMLTELWWVNKNIKKIDLGSSSDSDSETQSETVGRGRR
jgi:uncharacterized protein YdhG (YjbR/CyaY superfamily)